jgi:hypothetical protein
MRLVWAGQATLRRRSLASKTAFSRRTGDLRSIAPCRSLCPPAVPLLTLTAIRTGDGKLSNVAGDQPIARVRTPERVGNIVRLEGLIVAILAALPLTASGHYVVNVARGESAAGFHLATAAWLIGFSVIGVTLVMAATAAILPGWRRATRATVAQLAIGVVAATIDYWRLVDGPTGLLLNVAGLGVVAAALQSIYWTPRSPLTAIALRPSERMQEWFAGVLILGGTLAFALPHPSTVDGVAEDCSPMWLFVERDCASSDIIWWPAALAAIVLGALALSIIHQDPASITDRQGLRGSQRRRRRAERRVDKRRRAARRARRRPEANQRRGSRRNRPEQPNSYWADSKGNV